MKVLGHAARQVKTAESWQPKSGSARQTGGAGNECAPRRGNSPLDALQSLSSIERVLDSPSQPLDPHVRSFLEPRFGRDFSQVRVHTDPGAAHSASQLDARAWTLGDHIAFGPGMYSPNTPRGAGLLAHELTHVVQQQGVEASSQPTIGRSGDRFEREADSHASLLSRGLPVPPATVVSAPVLQRTLLSGFLDVVLFIPRLFGLEAFPAEQLRYYLADIRARKGPARTLFSDNKARACVSREAELGPYDAQTKIWLIQDMLDGWTSFLDENAIIDLLGRSRAQIPQILAGVGRDLLWSKFDGRKRRIIEAMTMTAADAGDALVSRLRNLTPDELQDYAGNTTDPAVLESVRRATGLSNITAPVPVAATIGPGGQADITINGIQIVVRPDSVNPSIGNHAYTHGEFHFELHAPVAITPANANQGVALGPPLVNSLTIWTEFPSEESKSGSSGYGAGKTLREHERAHGQGWFDFVRNNPPPVFQGQEGMAANAYNTAAAQYQTAVRDYQKRALDFALRAGDCSVPGRLPTDAQLAGTGFTASICRQD